MQFITDAKSLPEWKGSEKQKILVDMEARFTANYNEVRVNNVSEKVGVVKETQKETKSLNTDTLENTDFVKKF
jgi:hypothetical protein